MPKQPTPPHDRNASPKRVRFNDQETTESQTPLKPILKGPSAIAREFVTEAVASLPSSIKSLVIEKSLFYNKLQSTKRQRVKTTNRLREDNFIPRSARINFSITASSRVTEIESFKTLKDETDKYVEEVQNKLKALTIKVSEMEEEDITKQIQDCFFESLEMFASLGYYACYPNETDNLDTASITRFLLEKYTAPILNHVSLTPDTVLAKYSTYKKDGVTYEKGSTPETTATKFATVVEDTDKVMKIVFQDSWEKQLQFYDAKEKDDLLAKKIAEFKLAKTSNDIDMELEQETPLDAKTMQDLIDARVNERTKSLETKLARLQQQTKRAKNNQRGAPGGASTKKKTPQTTTTNNNGNGQNSPGSNRSNSESPKEPRNRKKKKKKKQNGQEGNNTATERGRKQHNNRTRRPNSNNSTTTRKQRS